MDVDFYVYATYRTLVTLWYLLSLVNKKPTA